MPHATIGKNGCLEIDHDAIEREVRRLRSEAVRESYSAIRAALRRGFARIGSHGA